MAGPITGDLAEFGAQLSAAPRRRWPTSTRPAACSASSSKLEEGDDQCDPKQAPIVANDLVSKGVVFVAGHFCSGSSIPASAVYHEEGILQITPASTNPKFTDDAAASGWTTVFRTCGRDDQQGSFAGPWIAEHFKGKNVAIVHDKSPYGQGLADLTKAALNDAGHEGGHVRGDHRRASRTTPRSSRKMKEAKIDVIYFGGYHPEAALIVKQAREQGLQGAAAVGRLAEHAGVRHARRHGVRRRDVHQRRRGAQPAVGRRRWSRSSATRASSPRATRSAPTPRSRCGRRPSTKAGTTDSAKVADDAAQPAWDTVIGKLGFDAKGDLTSATYVWYVFKDGKYSEAQRHVTAASSSLNKRARRLARVPGSFFCVARERRRLPDAADRSCREVRQSSKRLSRPRPWRLPPVRPRPIFLAKAERCAA